MQIKFRMNRKIFLYDLSIKYESNKLNPLSATGLQLAKGLSTQKNLYGLGLTYNLLAKQLQHRCNQYLRHYPKSAGEKNLFSGKNNLHTTVESLPTWPRSTNYAIRAWS